jgi:hypothetical protein
LPTIKQQSQNFIQVLEAEKSFELLKYALMQYCEQNLTQNLTEIGIFHQEEVEQKPKFCATFWMSQNDELYLNLFQHFFSIFHQEKVFHASSVRYFNP